MPDLDRKIYLDHNATAPLRPGVADTIARSLGATGNPSSVHAFGRDARRIVEDAREDVAALVNCAASDIIFTSGGTEANNLALSFGARRNVVISAIEHDSVTAAAPKAFTIPVTSDGIVEADAVRRLLASVEGDKLVSVMLANNETGAIQPVADIAEIAHQMGAIVHCDAIQAPGKIAVDFRALGVDMMSLSAHKIGGPQGVGALVAREDLDLPPQIRGGGQERRKRAGTENVPGIAGFGAAARLIRETTDESERIRNLRDRLEDAVLGQVSRARIYGSGTRRLPNTSCIGIPGIKAETQVMALDLAGIAISAGSACSSGKVTPSHVLRAMGAGDDEAASAIRVSLGWSTTEEDIDSFVGAWTDFCRRKSAA